jgi:peptidylprolyl isomerase
MKRTIMILLMAATAAAAAAQAPAKPAPHAASAAKPAAKPAAAGDVKLPPGVPPVPGPQKIAFSLRYQDILIGTGADAVPNKMYKVNYIGWLAADGHKFDSSADHRTPVTDKDGKPVLDADGKPKLGDPQPIAFPQGFGRVIPGWDQGFNGMKIGGKRRLFIPWQLAYGAAGRPGPDPAHPVIPAKADLIFDVELVDITEMPQPPSRPSGPGGASAPIHVQPQPGAGASPNGASPAPGIPGAPPAHAAPATATPAPAPAPAQAK